MKIRQDVRHPCGIARGQVDGPGAAIRNVGGTKSFSVQIALDGHDIDDDDHCGKTQ